MYDLSANDITAIHKHIQQRFNISPAIKDPGLIESIAERPNTKLFDKFEPFDNIYLKAASLLEGLVRMHPFIDGNKRTGLLSTYTFMTLNGYELVFPVDAVRFTVEMAKNENNDPETTTAIIADAARWIEKISAKNTFVAVCKGLKYYSFPMLGLLFLILFKQKKRAGSKIIKWMAYDLEPQRVEDLPNTLSFFLEIIQGKYSGILSRDQP